MDQARRGLTEADRQLLDRLVQARVRATAAPTDPDKEKAKRTAGHSAWLDFGNLPGYAEQRLLRSAASALGLRDPYLPRS